MTLVRNRLQLSSGNRYVIFILSGLLLAACSPKIRPVVVTAKPVDTTTAIVKKPEIKPVVPPVLQPVTTISLLLPFNLDGIDLSEGAPRASLANADVAMDYYQGFKLALDSLTTAGANYRLQVFDTKGATTQAYNLALNTKVRTSTLIVGPVFPEEIKSFSVAAPDLKRMMISPLSPSSPAEYKNINLVTVIPPLEYHCWEAAKYIQTNLKARTVFILKSGYSQDNKYSIPFKKALDSLSKRRIKIIELTVVRGDLTALLPYLSTTGQNIFVMPATDQQFVQVTLHSLDLLLKRHYPITIFAHPNWKDASFLTPDLLQRLNTYITSGDKVDYKSANVTRFVKEYRKTYHAEPGEYAIKGFDEGLYFGQLAASNNKTLTDANELHNTFHFVNKPGMGYVNTHVKLYKYLNFELKPVE